MRPYTQPPLRSAPTHEQINKYVRRGAGIHSHSRTTLSGPRVHVHVELLSVMNSPPDGPALSVMVRRPKKCQTVKPSKCQKCQNAKKNYGESFAWCLPCDSATRASHKVRAEPCFALSFRTTDCRNPQTLKRPNAQTLKRSNA